MSTTHYSDVIRLLLLKRYGGIWLDATVLIKEKFEVSRGSFFAFTRPKDPLLLSVWYLWVQEPDNYLVSKWLDSLLNYWSRESLLRDYFLLHYLFEANYHQDRKFRKIWNAREIHSFEEPHLLQSILLDEYDEAAFRMIIATTGIHKLTWKLPQYISNRSNLNYLLNSN